MNFKMMIPLTVIALTSFAAAARAASSFDSTTLVRAPAGWRSDIDRAKGALTAEKDSIEKKQSAIDDQAAPLGKQLNAVMDKIDAQNAVVAQHNDRCGGSSDDEDEVAACNEEADRLNAVSDDLNSQKAALVGPLQAFLDQYNQLEDRRQTILADLSKLEAFAKQSQACAEIQDPTDAAGCLNELWANGLPVAAGN